MATKFGNFVAYAVIAALLGILSGFVSLWAFPISESEGAIYRALTQPNIPTIQEDRQ